MRLAVDVEDGALGIAAERAGAGLMGAARDRNVRLHIQVARNQMMMHAQVSQHRLELVVQLLVSHLVVGPIAQRDLAEIVDRDAIVGLGQVLGREPKIDGMAREISQ